MKIFVSYKETGLEESELHGKLEKIKEIIWNIGHGSFVYHLDTKYDNPTAKEVMEKAKSEIETSDIVLAFINYPWKSEGMLLELGIAKALGKEILTLVNKEIENEYFLTYWISDNTVFFDKFEDIEKLLKYNLPAYKY